MPLGRLRYRLEDNIEINLRFRAEGMDWNYLVQSKDQMPNFMKNVNEL
jgi:hypothetical protein